MVQNNFDISLVGITVKTNPEVKNKVLYALSNAISNNQKTQVRKLKAKIKKGTKKIPPGVTKDYTKIDAETIENTLLKLVNTGQITPSLVKSMVEFFIKIKEKTDVMEEDIDMEVFKLIGKSATTDN